MKKTIAMGLVCMSAFTFAMDDASNVSTSSLTMEQKEKLHTVRQEFRADAKEFAQEKQDIVQDKRQKLADFRKDRREDAMKYKKDCKTQIDAVETEDEKNLDYIFLSVVDILEEKNTTFVAGEKELQLLKEIFAADTKNAISDLGSRISRKKQIAPDLKAHFEK